MISNIEQIQPIARVKEPEKSGAVSPVTGSFESFGSIFRSAIDNVKTTDAEKSQMQYQLSVGELDNPALLMIAQSKNQIAVDLLVQLRNKALDAYSEITRISL